MTLVESGHDTKNNKQNNHNICGKKQTKLKLVTNFVILRILKIVYKNCDKIVRNEKFRE